MNNMMRYLYFPCFLLFHQLADDEALIIFLQNSLFLVFPYAKDNWRKRTVHYYYIINMYHYYYLCESTAKQCIWNSALLPRAYFNLQLMTISAVVKCNLQLQNGNCAVVVVNLEVREWKRGVKTQKCWENVEWMLKKGQKKLLVQLYLQGFEWLKL